MNRFLRFVPTCRTFLILLVTALIGALAVVVDADAQERREAVVISIFRGADNVCTYDILDQANDEMFIVGPDSPVLFLAADNVQARVRITGAGQGGARESRNPDDAGIPGLAGPNADFVVSAASPGVRRSRPTRATGQAPVERGARSTFHKVIIRCRNAAGEEEERSVGRNSGPDAGASFQLENGMQTDLDFEQFELAVPASRAASEIDSARREGGPDMEVEDP